MNDKQLSNEQNNYLIPLSNRTQSLIFSRKILKQKVKQKNRNNKI